VEALQKGSALAGAPSLAAEGAGAEEKVTEEIEVVEEKEGKEVVEMEQWMDGNPYVFGPNLYLASIVDKENYRGYCLDIAGSPPHPQCGNVQGHSCKSDGPAGNEGEDTQWEYDVDRRMVRSVNFNRACNPLYSSTKNDMSWEADEDITEPACLTVNGQYKPGSDFSLTGCSEDMTWEQTIVYTSNRQLRVGQGNLCVVLGMNQTAAYEDFLIRTAELQSCTMWPAELSTWEVLLADHTKLREPLEPTAP